MDTTPDDPLPESIAPAPLSLSRQLRIIQEDAEHSNSPPAAPSSSRREVRRGRKKRRHVFFLPLCESEGTFSTHRILVLCSRSEVYTIKTLDSGCLNTQNQNCCPFGAFSDLDERLCSFRLCCSSHPRSLTHSPIRLLSLSLSLSLELSLHTHIHPLDNAHQPNDHLPSVGGESRACVCAAPYLSSEHQGHCLPVF
jgi:hypothetical protein